MADDLKLSRKTPLRLYRAEAHYHDGKVVVRHFQNSARRSVWISDRQRGYEAFTNPQGRRFEAIPPALKVVVFDSDPVQWHRAVVLEAPGHPMDRVALEEWLAQ